MPLIQWNSSLSVNIAEIDRQHQKLVAMIKDLNDAMRQGKGKDVLGKIVNGLMIYTETHFRTEEAYFDQWGYLDANRHKKEHAEFTRKVAEFKTSFDTRHLGLSIEVMNFLSTWLQDHIKGSDMQYGPFLNEKGLK